MRLLLFSLVSTKISHSPSRGITAAAVLKDSPNASRVYENRVFSCSSVKRSIAATASAADSSRACRKKRTTAHVHMHKRHPCRYCAFLAAKLK